MITAMVPQQRADHILISPDKENQDLLHCPSSRLQCLARDSRSCRSLFSCSPRRPSTTMSTPGKSNRFARKLSRTKRLIRLRDTARRTCFFAIANPSRASLVPLRRASVVKHESADLRGFWKTRWNSCGLSSRAVRGKRPDAFTGNALRSRRQPDPSFSTTGFDHLAPVSGRHARAEAMCANTLQITGLKCSFHIDVPIAGSKMSGSPRERAAKPP